MLFHKTIDSGTIYNLIKHEQFKYIFKKTKPLATICNFEGNAIERIIYLSSSIINKKINKIGYSHTTSFPNRNSVYLKLNNYLMPNIILLNSENLLNEFSKKGFNNLYLLGLLSKDKKRHVKLKKNKKNILIIPEGIQNEFDEFYKFSKNISKKYPNYNFILRPHPIKKIEYNEKFDNLIISNRKINYDLGVSNYVFFRGTTLIIKCIKNKLIPIYVNFGEQYSFNIFENSLRKFIYEINADNIDNIDFESMKLDKNIYDFSNNFFSKFDKTQLESLINILYKK